MNILRIFLSYNIIAEERHRYLKTKKVKNPLNIITCCTKNNKLFNVFKSEV